MFRYSSLTNIRDISISNGLSRHRYYKPRRSRRPRRPWYSYPRPRPSPSEIDRRFINWLRRKLRERERINTEDEVSDSDEGEEVDPPELPKPEVSSRLHITDVDLHIAQNTKGHNTYMYECIEDRIRESDGSQQKAELVIRRGQPFLITFKFDRPYDIKKNDITMTFTLVAGEGKSTVKETFKVNENKSGRHTPKKWGATLVRKEGTKLTVEVFAPASCPIGAWELSVKTIVDREDDKDLIWQYNHNEEINILFNPWCKEDVVYMPDQAWLKEAVLNDSGAVFYGNFRQIGSSTWEYGQFDEGILDAAFHLLRRGFDFHTSKAMGKAARVARIFSKIVNSQDDDGLLVGNWTDDYSGGVSPTSWTGSVKILKQYMKTAKPVKFAQCWVFSHVLTTICRAVGLPCRSLTNFASAHNTDKDHLSHDEKYIKDSEGELHELGSADSIWNFHVWNEVWMSRPDLGSEFDGWQAIDATPQEESEGVYCCGPAPVKAIKEGLINTGQDTAFVFAEVNSDKVEWLVDGTTGEETVMSRTGNAIGKKISTKQPTGTVGQERLDITDQYKYQEGSPKEREVVRKSEKLFRQDNLDVSDEETPPPKVVDLEIVYKDDIYIGSGFDVEVVAINGSDKPRTINLSVKVEHKTYYGERTGTATKKKFNNEKLDPGERKTFILEVSSKEALKRPKEGFNFQIKAVADVVETCNFVTKKETYRLRRPDMEVQGPTTAKVKEPLKVEVSFTNPLLVRMTNCKIEVGGNLKPVPLSADTITVGDILAGETWKGTVKLVPGEAPRNSKERYACLGLESDQMNGIIGSYKVQLR